MQTSTVSRRDLLLAGAATGVSLACLPRHAAFAAPFSNMQFGLVTYLWGEEMDLPTLLTACVKSGLRGVELRTEHKHGVEPNLTAEQRIEVKQRFADAGVQLVGYGANCEFHASDMDVVKKNIEQAKEYVRLMHDCGGTGVKVKPNGFIKGAPKEKTFEQIGKALNEVAEYGYNYGQEIRVEVHGKGTQELPNMKAIFDVATHANVKVCWNSNPEDLIGDGLEANFNMVKDRFGSTVHVRELDDTGYPYPALMKLFKSINYEGWILLEARTKPADKIAAMTAQRELFEKLIAS